MSAALFATARGRLSPEDYATIRAKREAGVGIQNIANMVGCSTVDVRAVLSGDEPIRSVAPPPRPAPVNEVRDARLRAMWLDGSSIDEIARELRIKPAAVTRVRVKLGLKPRATIKADTWLPEHDAYVREHYIRLGETAASVAKALDRTSGAVVGRAYRMGWSRRAPRQTSASAPASITGLVNQIAAPYGYTFADLCALETRRPISMVRQMAFAAIQDTFPALTTVRIGQIFGGRDHSTVIFGVERHKARMAWVEFLKWAARPQAHPRLSAFEGNAADPLLDKAA